MNKFSISEALSVGWAGMKANFWFFVGLLLIIMALMAVVPLVLTGFPQAEQQFRLQDFVAGIWQLVFGILVNIAVVVVTLQVVDGQKPSYSALFDRAHLFWRFLGANILYNLIIAGGLLLLIIPGIIWGIKYSFFRYFVVDKGMGPVEALKHSGRVTDGQKWRLFLFGLVLGLVNVAGALALGIGLLATIPTTMLATAFVYSKLASSLEPAVIAEPINGQATGM